MRRATKTTHRRFFMKICQTRPISSRQGSRKSDTDAPSSAHVHVAEIESPCRFDGGFVKALRQGITRELQVSSHLGGKDNRFIVRIEGSLVHAVALQRTDTIGEATLCAFSSRV